MVNAVGFGGNAVSIKQLVEEGKDVPVYSTNNDGKVEIISWHSGGVLIAGGIS